MKALVLSLSFFLISNAFGQESSDADNRSLNDVVIKETYEIGTEEEKLPIVLKSDFTNLVEIQERIQWSSVPWTSEQGNSSFKLFDFRTSKPELIEIIPEPAKVFYVNFKDLSSWKLQIYASDGSNFRSLSGEGNPPSSIFWDGRGDSQDPLIPGEQYSYSFTAIDKAGNRRTFPGESFSVPALFLKNGEDVWVGISYALLFSPDGYGLARQAEDYSKELVNFILYYANKGKIKVQSSHSDTQEFLKLVANKLGRDITFFEQDPIPKPKNYFMMQLN
jgi:hypothetical protein